MRKIPARPDDARKGYDDSSDEQGVALLMVLSVMTLLAATALTLVYQSIQSRKYAIFSQNRMTARLYLHTALNEVDEFLTYEFSDMAIPTNLFPATKPDQDGHYGPTFSLDADWDGRYYWVSHVTGTGSDTDVTGFNDIFHVRHQPVDITPATFFSSTLNAGSDSASWINLYDDGDSYPNNDTPIVARYAYMIIDESGKLDPTAVCSTGTAEGAESRLGASVDEINLKNVIGATLAAKLQPVTHTGGLLPVTTRWFSYYEIVRRFFASDSDVWTSANVQSVVRNIFPYSYDIEAFHNGQLDKHRFNLGRTDWGSDTMTVNLILTDAKDFWTADNTGGIPWLALSGESTARKNQIAANLIDYCDTDVKATTDYPGTNPPTYCGNDQVPYINEFVISVQADGAGALDIKLFPEFVNIYDQDAGAGGKLDVTLRVTGDQLTPSSTDLSYSWSSVGTVLAKKYLDPTSVNQAASHTPPNLTQFKVRILSALYRDSSGNLWDFCQTDTSAAAVDFNTSALQFASVEVNDPRHNLDAAQWTWSAWQTSMAGTLDNNNTAMTINPGGDKDPESVASKPWEVSTAYIRNDTMKSPWELGAIHRGAAWETLNLKAYSPVEVEQIATTGLGTYANGDANILSQVKLADDTEVTGRVNINTYNSNVLTGLLQGIKVNNGKGSHYDDTGGTALSAANAAAMIGQSDSVVSGTITAVNGAADGEPFRLRGQLASVPKMVDGSVVTQSTDAAQEVVVGKIANLSTVRQNLFTVILCAQTIKDTISGYKGGTRGVYDDGIDLIIAQKNVITLMYRDAFTNRLRVERQEFLEE